jgi:hypothetical protein
MQASIQHGNGTNDPLTYELVQAKNSPLWWQERGLMYTPTGYGSRIPTHYMVKYNGKWRRVYCMVYSNACTLYIGKRSDNLIVEIDT